LLLRNPENFDMQSVSGVRLPDSPLCAAATAYARSVSDPFLFNHVLRSYVFAELCGRAEGLAYDRELLYLACVLHDLGLTAIAPASERFEVEGADAAREFLARQGLSDRALDTVWDAIALHTTMTIPQRKAPEIALCQRGIAVDVGFVPLAAAPGAAVPEILAAFPRLGFKRALLDALERLYRRNPAAATSHAVADVCERRVPGFCRLHLCDVAAAAPFPE
jgi:hypothetical protein